MQYQLVGFKSGFRYHTGSYPECNREVTKGKFDEPVVIKRADKVFEPVPIEDEEAYLARMAQTKQKGQKATSRFIPLPDDIQLDAKTEKMLKEIHSHDGVGRPSTWSLEEDITLCKYAQLESNEATARRLGKSTNALRHRLGKLRKSGVVKDVNTIRKEMDSYIIKNHLKLSRSQMAQELFRDTQYIHSRMERLKKQGLIGEC